MALLYSAWNMWYHNKKCLVISVSGYILFDSNRHVQACSALKAPTVLKQSIINLFLMTMISLLRVKISHVHRHNVVDLLRHFKYADTVILLLNVKSTVMTVSSIFLQMTHNRPMCIVQGTLWTKMIHIILYFQSMKPSFDYIEWLWA